MYHNKTIKFYIKHHDLWQRISIETHPHMVQAFQEKFGMQC